MASKNRPRPSSSKGPAVVVAKARVRPVDAATKWEDHIESRLFCSTHLEIPVGELIFHVFNLALNEKMPGWSFWEDRHNHHELIYTCDGQGTYEIHDRRYVVHQGDLFFTPRNVRHNGWSHSNVARWKTFVIEFDFSLAHDPELFLDDIAVLPAVLPFYKHFILERDPTLHVPVDIQSHIELITERLTLEMASRGPDYELILQSCLIDYLVLITRAARQTLDKVPLHQYAGRVKRLIRLEKARQFVQQHYAENLRLEDIAAQAHVSPFHFVRLFKEAFGVTPNQYHQQLRIEEAKRLLVMTDLQVAEIADRLGYSSPEYFSRTFSAHVGASPRRFVRQLADSTHDPV